MKNSVSFRSLMMGLMVTSLMLPLSSANGQQKPEPAVVVAVASINDQLDDVEYLAAATSEAIGQMSGLIRFQAQGFLAGVDFTKPSGVFLYFEEDTPEPKGIGFFPVKNIDDLLDKISEFAEVEEDGEQITILPDNGEELTLVNKDGYAFVSDSDELMSSLPANPLSLIAEQSKAYNFSARVFPQRIPESLRDQALDFIRDGFESAMDEMDELQAELQEAQFEMQMKQMELMVNDFEVLTVGLNADKDTERVFLDINMKGMSGSEMSKKLAASKTSRPSQFTGFLMENAAFTVHNCSGIDAEDAKMSMETLSKLRDTMLEEMKENDDADENEIALLTKITDQLMGVLNKTMEAGTLDMGGVVFTDDGINAAFGAKVVDANELESAIKEIVAEAESKIEGDEVVFNLNSGTHGGVNLHEIAIAIDEEEFDEALTQMFGDKINVLLGIGKDQVYLALGKDPSTIMKKSIDANASASAVQSDVIGEYNFFVAPIMDLVAKIESDEAMVEQMRDKIAEAGKDRIRFTYDVVDGEMKIRFEMQDGIFQMFGAAAEAMNGMGGGGADF